MTTIHPRVALTALLLTPGWCLAQGPGRPTTSPDETAFARGLRRVHETMARGRFAKCREALRTLLKRHRDQPYVFVQKAVLLEDYRRCAFYLEFKTPTPNDALHGELLHHDPAHRQVKVRYTPKTLGDFDEPENAPGSVRKLTWHPAVWRAPYSIEVRGESYQQTVHPIDRVREVRVGTSLHIGGTEAGHVEIAFGNQPGRYGKRPARIVAWRESRQTELQTKDSPARVGTAFTLRIDVRANSIRAFYNGKLLLQQKRSAEGTFAIEGRSFDTLTVTGTVDPGWIRGRIDHRRQVQLDEFDRKYTADEVPEWLLAGKIPDSRSFNPAEAWPSDASEKHHPILRDVVAMFEKGRYAEGLRYVKESGRDVLPSDTRSYLMARFCSALDEIDQAIGHCERLVENDPQFLTGRQLRAELWVRQGQGEDAAVADYRRMIAAHPHARELYIDLAVLLIQSGRAKDAEAVLADAVRATGNQKELMTLQRMLIALTRGPAWRQTFEHRSTHYIVRSNIDKALCRTAARILEDAHKVYTRTLGNPRHRAKEPYRVFLFAGHTGYERFCNDILGERDTHTAGLYSATLKQLLIWNLPYQRAMLRTIRHEGFHQYLDSRVHDAPAWLNEGFAEYFEATPEGANATVRRDHLRSLARQPMMATGKFIRMPWKIFYRGSGYNYAQAWALVHFLRHGPEKWRGILPAILSHLGSGKSPKSAVKKGFSKVDTAALHRDLEAWLADLRER